MRFTKISIHAPHEGERRRQWICRAGKNGFQSTLPTRGSDALGAVDDQLQRIFQSTLPTRGSDYFPRLTRRLLLYVFQSTLPTRGSDGAELRYRPAKKEFQSTLPTRGSDNYLTLAIYPISISIHAPHEGERLSSGADKTVTILISIHAPHEGERQHKLCRISFTTNFNPRSPRGGATQFYLA